MKHTTEPWLTIDNNFIYALNEDGTNRFHAAITRGYKSQNKHVKELISEEELAANTALMHAAPDLLEALEQVINWTVWSDNHPKLAKARAAIAKAKQITK